MLIRDILTGVGYFVLEAAHAEDALVAAENYPERIDLMVSDIVMPGISGFELSKRLASNRPDMKVLFVSGYAEQETAKRAFADPNVAYLQKPFGPAELASKVAEIISGSRGFKAN